MIRTMLARQLFGRQCVRDNAGMDFEDKAKAILGLLLGIGFLAGGLWVRSGAAEDRLTKMETQGRVVENATIKQHDYEHNKDEIVYAPVIEFQAGSKPVRFRGKQQSYRASEGNTVVVLYDPGNPAAARVVDPLEGLTQWAMFGMGGFAILATVWPLARGWMFSGRTASS